MESVMELVPDRFTVNGVKIEVVHRHKAVAGGRGGRGAEYSIVHCLNARVIGRPGAVVFAVVGQRGRTVGKFAIEDGKFLELGR